ncbi:hypothetical protein ACFYW1_10660 [Streptomyces sp. NPDC002669]|uniref:hypothetical protein n=1 Tax=Streptomyces sp. NPDC002669 TaxID=3364658 RepID=UPI0036B4ECF8
MASVAVVESPAAGGPGRRDGGCRRLHPRYERKAEHFLACAVMVTDLAANWYAVYGIQHSNLAAQPGLQRLTVFAALVLGAAPFIRRHLTN